MSLSLLFVDDEVDLLEVYKDSFETNDRKVFVASSVDEALQVIRENKIDIVFSDYRMPVKSGLELAKALAGKIPVYLISGDLGAESLVSSEGVSGVILKPMKSSTIDRILETHSQSAS